MSLYTKYRPRDWDSVVSQDYITTILRNSLKSGKVSHAYLFHGSRGTGKTTSARILAKALNCTDLQDGNPCHKCTNCQAFDNEMMLDIIEIDGASNNGVENVRELIERARFEPNQGKYKIYIIDEVHMLSTGAFNALLKILEEPPTHVKFILATTEIDKVPETIRSRTLRFDFRKITMEDIVSRLEYVAKSESVKADPEAIAIIAKAARGGLRDALTLMEQNIIDSEVSAEHVRHTLSLVEESLIEECTLALRDRDLDTIKRIIASLKERHVQVRSFFDQMMYHLRDRMIESLNNANFRTYSDILSMFEEAYGKIRILPDGMMLIELTLLRIVKRDDSGQMTEDKGKMTNEKGQSNGIKIQEPRIKEEKTKNESVLSSGAERRIQEQKETLPESNPSNTTEETAIEQTSSPTNQLTNQPAHQPNNNFSFPRLINKLRESNPALTTDLKTARFSLHENTLTLLFSKNWNYERVNTPKVKNIVSETCSEIFDGEWEVRCELKEGGTSNISDGVF